MSEGLREAYKAKAFENAAISQGGLMNKVNTTHIYRELFQKGHDPVFLKNGAKDMLIFKSLYRGATAGIIVGVGMLVYQAFGAMKKKGQ